MFLVSCDFTNDVCGWTQAVTNDFNWTRHSGDTPTQSTGPDGDHTDPNGLYKTYKNVTNGFTD